MDGDALHDLTDEQRAALVAMLDAIEHGDGGHADAIARGLDAGDDEDGTELDDATDVWDEGESK